jgi:hypothetical protein
MTFEALILQRLQRIPEKRRQEWLRRLLVQGFLGECRERREADGEAFHRQAVKTPRPNTAFSDWLAERAPTSGARPAATMEPRDPPKPVTADTQDKPFAHLRKVIG